LIISAWQLIPESADWIKELPAATAIALVIEQKTLQLNKRDIEKLCSKIIAASGLDYSVTRFEFTSANISWQELLLRVFGVLFCRSEFVVLIK
jgi:hypothetical protein